jgi:hypothetical protein
MDDFNTAVTDITLRARSCTCGLRDRETRFEPVHASVTNDREIVRHDPRSLVYLLGRRRDRSLGVCDRHNEGTEG